MVSTKRLKIELQQGIGGMVRVPCPTSHPLFRVRNNNGVSHGEPLDHEDCHLRYFLSAIMNFVVFKICPNDVSRDLEQMKILEIYSSFLISSPKLHYHNLWL